MKKYVYPKLGKYDLGFVRLSGPGLANCMFMASKAYLTAKEQNASFVAPSWRKISIGPLLRGERDLRAYTNLFKTEGVQGLKKLWVILLDCLKSKSVSKIEDISGYFQPFYGLENDVRDYIRRIINPEAVKKIDDCDFTGCIGVHVRLGDYVPERRIPLSWYIEMINLCSESNPELEFLVFSDGSDEELSELLKLHNVRRAFFGNALADIVALSKCKAVIASDSTFSAWGAFLGDKPIIFKRRHFPPVYSISEKEFVYDNEPELTKTSVNKFVK